MKQLINLMRQHRFYAAVTILGTAMTLAFVMVVVMIYHFRTADLEPEVFRTRGMYDVGGQVSRPDGSNNWGYHGLSRRAFEALYDSLPGVDATLWHGGLAKAICSLPASADRHAAFVRPVSANWFGCFHYHFVAGRPFTQSEYDAGRAAFESSGDEWRISQSRQDGVVRRFVVISERLARQLFGSCTAAVGSQMQMDFEPVQVVGVVSDVSSVFQVAYADVWEPFTLLHEDSRPADPVYDLLGSRYAVLRLKPGAKAADIRTEVDHRLDRLNNSGLEYVLRDLRLYTHTEYTFFRGSDLDARLVYALLLLVLMVVPAVGMSGLVHAQMQSRMSEIAIRKAYGATNADIVGQLFRESLCTTLLGGVLGYLLSCLLLLAGSTWLLGTGGVQQADVMVGGDLLLRPWLFFAVLVACLLFNVLSTLLPVWMAVRRNVSYILVGGE